MPEGLQASNAEINVSKLSEAHRILSKVQLRGPGRNLLKKTVEFSLKIVILKKKKINLQMCSSYSPARYFRCLHYLVV